MINIIIIILIISWVCVFIYVFGLPWFKGTMVSDNDENCAGMGKKCKEDSWCCRDPRQGGAYCLSKECSDIRLETASDKNTNFFNIYSISIIILLFILILIKLKYKY